MRPVTHTNEMGATSNTELSHQTQTASSPSSSGRNPNSSNPIWPMSELPQLNFPLSPLSPVHAQFTKRPLLSLQHTASNKTGTNLLPLRSSSSLPTSFRSFGMFGVDKDVPRSTNDAASERTNSVEESADYQKQASPQSSSVSYAHTDPLAYLVSESAARPLNDWATQHNREMKEQKYTNNNEYIRDFNNSTTRSGKDTLEDKGRLRFPSITSFNSSPSPFPYLSPILPPFPLAYNSNANANTYTNTNTKLRKIAPLLPPIQSTPSTPALNLPSLLPSLPLALTSPKVSPPSQSPTPNSRFSPLKAIQLQTTDTKIQTQTQTHTQMQTQTQTHKYMQQQPQLQTHPAIEVDRYQQYIQPQQFFQYQHRSLPGATDYRQCRPYSDLAYAPGYEDEAKLIPESEVKEDQRSCEGDEVKWEGIETRAERRRRTGEEGVEGNEEMRSKLAREDVKKSLKRKREANFAIRKKSKSSEASEESEEEKRLKTKAWMNQANAGFLKCQEASCLMTFPSRAAMSRHYLQVHYEPKPQLASPEHSEDSNSSEESPKPNEIRKIKIHSCPVPGCSRKFSNTSNLHTHIRVHTGHKPYVCTHDGCGKRFTEKGHLSNHVRSHTGEKPFACTWEGCSRAFAAQSNLIRHMKLHATRDKK